MQYTHELATEKSLPRRRRREKLWPPRPNSRRRTRGTLTRRAPSSAREISTSWTMYRSNVGDQVDLLDFFGADPLWALLWLMLHGIPIHPPAHPPIMCCRLKVISPNRILLSFGPTPYLLELPTRYHPPINYELRVWLCSKAFNHEPVTCITVVSLICMRMNIHCKFRQTILRVFPVPLCKYRRMRLMHCCSKSRLLVVDRQSLRHIDKLQ